MNRVIAILILVFVSQIGLGQSIKDLSAVEKKNLYQGIIYSERSMCLKANQLLNTFITNYKGDNLTYWHDKARSYLLDCNESTLNPKLSYQYHPSMDNPIKYIEHVDHENEESLAVDLVIFRDLHRHTFDNILSLTPEAFYPLIDVTSDNSAENHTHTDHEHEEYLALDVKLFKDLHRYTFDAITSMTPEVKYPLLDSTSIEIETSTDDQGIDSVTPSIYVPQKTPKQKPEIRIYISDQDASVKTSEEVKIYTGLSDRNAKMAQTEIRIYTSEKDVSSENNPISIWPEQVEPLRAFTADEIESLKQQIKQTAANPQLISKIIKNRKKTKDKKKTSPKQISEVITSEVISYHILFRVLDNPYETFDDLNSIGPLYRETYDSKGNSRYLIGNTNDIKVAEELLIKVKNAGYPSSFIAEYKDGQLNKVIN